MCSSTRGFASNSPAQRKWVSYLGGRKKVKKGFGAMPPDKAKKIQSAGGIARAKKLKEGNDGKEIQV